MSFDYDYDYDMVTHGITALPSYPVTLCIGAVSSFIMVIAYVALEVSVGPFFGSGALFAPKAAK
uniref:Uncharacterized protein n=1 Tax=Timema poppense TaxID=170557 RepID=A0A7R9GTN9_TIMPO|nr:unnamed protein product [Timema poppensis]